MLFYHLVSLCFVIRRKEGAAAQKAADDTSPLGQAALKFMDALSMEESKSIFHFHVGRSLVIQGSYEEATKRLEATLGWNEKHDMAKYTCTFDKFLEMH